MKQKTFRPEREGWHGFTAAFEEGWEHQLERCHAAVPESVYFKPCAECYCTSVFPCQITPTFWTALFFFPVFKIASTLVADWSVELLVHTSELRRDCSPSGNAVDECQHLTANLLKWNTQPGLLGTALREL